MFRAVSCSLTEPAPALSLVHLLHLEELTLRGVAEDIMNDLLESTAVPVLPASLQTLRLQNQDGRGDLQLVPR